ncbi:DUF2793 domain-containing protein [bacterium]|nr:DUF2793 domain-containing protein [bacterium]
MAQYTTGTVTTTAGSNVVTGDSTSWLANLDAGDLFQVDGDTAWFTIATVDSNTQITLAANYPSTNSAADYVAVTDFTNNLNLPLLYSGDLHAAEIISRAFRLLDASTVLGLSYQGVVNSKAYGSDTLLPSGEPADGDRYIVDGVGADEWEDEDGNIATWDDASGEGWSFEAPEDGWLVIVLDEDLPYVYDADTETWNQAGTPGILADYLSLTETGTQTVTGPVAFSSTVAVGGSEIITGNLQVGLDAVLLGDLNLTGDLFADHIKPNTTDHDVALQLKSDSYAFSFLNTAGGEVASIDADGDVHTVKDFIIDTAGKGLQGTNSGITIDGGTGGDLILGGTNGTWISAVSALYVDALYPYTAAADVVLRLRNDSYDFSFLNTAGGEVASINASGVATVTGLASSGSVYGTTYWPKVAAADYKMRVQNDSYDFSFLNTAGAEVAFFTSAGNLTLGSAGGGTLAAGIGNFTTSVESPVYNGIDAGAHTSIDMDQGGSTTGITMNAASGVTASFLFSHSLSAYSVTDDLAFQVLGSAYGFKFRDELGADVFEIDSDGNIGMDDSTGIYGSFLTLVGANTTIHLDHIEASGEDPNDILLHASIGQVVVDSADGLAIQIAGVEKVSWGSDGHMETKDYIKFTGSTAADKWLVDSAGVGAVGVNQGTGNDELWFTGTGGIFANNPLTTAGCVTVTDVTGANPVFYHSDTTYINADGTFKFGPVVAYGSGVGMGTLYANVWTNANTQHIWADLKAAKQLIVRNSSSATIATIDEATKALTVSGPGTFNAAVDGYAGTFFNDGGTIARIGVKIQTGRDDGAGNIYVDMFDGDGTNVANISEFDGTVALFDLSDEKVKKNTRPTVKDGLAVVRSTIISDYEMEKTGITVTGIVAQDLEAALPSAVITRPETRTGETFKMINRTALIPYLVKAIQQLTDRLEAIESAGKN